MSQQDSPQPKLIIDSDWKSQARAEKERLSQKVETPKAGSSPQSPDGTPGSEQPAEPGIQDIVSLLMTQALTYLGAFPDPRTGRAMVSLETSKVFIDLLKVLEDKTKGNLDAKEQQVLSRVLSELRMEYVEVAKYVEQAIAEGKIKQVTPGGPMTGQLGGPMGGPMGGMPGVPPGMSPGGLR